jgi:tRNA (guanine37-N1)-methyltransferase
VDEDISLGDFILSGGEIAAMALVDAVTRLIPGVLGSDESAMTDSFSDGLLEYPQYTRPPEFMGLKVPEILLSGNHELIRKWRRLQSLRKTRQLRPDLLAKITQNKEDRKLLSELEEND